MTDYPKMCPDHVELWMDEQTDDDLLVEIVSPLECQHPQCDDDRHFGVDR